MPRHKTDARAFRRTGIVEESKHEMEELEGSILDAALVAGIQKVDQPATRCDTKAPIAATRSDEQPEVTAARSRA